MAAFLYLAFLHLIMALRLRNEPEWRNFLDAAGIKKRLEYLRSRLQKDPCLKQVYTTFIDKLVENSFHRQVPTSTNKVNDGKLWYTLHHSVTHPKKSDKVRIGSDCAANFKNISLND